MGRVIRDTAILAGVQTAYNTPRTDLTGAANAMQVRKVNINALEATKIDTDLTLPYFGASPKIIGETYRKIDFEFLWGGTGVTTGTGTAPAYDSVLQMSGMVGVGGATPTRYSYSLLTTGTKWGTLDVYDSGVFHKYTDVVGDLEWSAGVDGIAYCKFSGIGKDSGDTAAATPALTLTAFKLPVAITDANSGDVMIGGTYATGVITGGTAYPSTGIQSIKLGNKTGFTPALGGPGVDISDRDGAVSVELDCTPAQEIAFLVAIRNATIQTLGLRIGTAVGASSLFWLPGVQWTEHKKVNKNGRRFVGLDGILVPVAGNDEVQAILL